MKAVLLATVMMVTLGPTFGSSMAVPIGPRSSQVGSSVYLGRALSEEKVRRWGAAVSNHRSGLVDSQAIEIASWTPAELYMLFGELRALAAFQKNPRVSQRSLDSVNYPGPELKERTAVVLGLHADTLSEVNRLIKRAVLLHTDIATIVPSPVVAAVVRSPFSGAVSVLIKDGQQVSALGPTVHLELAAWLLDGVKPNPAEDEDVRTWYESIAACSLRAHSFGSAEWLLRRAEALFPNDSLVHFYRGTLYEAQASPRLHDARQSSSFVQFEPMSVQDELGRAEQYFSRAVTLAPDFAEARLHFGRVLGQRGKNAQAIDELSRAAEGLSDAALRYYAGLFLGEVQARSGNLPAARQNLQRAHELYPSAQSALMALAELARRENDSIGAAAFLKELLALPHAEQARDDPWWWYSHSQVRDAETRLIAWRDAIVQETAR